MNKPASAVRDTQSPSFRHMLEASLLSDPDGEAFRHDGHSLSRSRLFAHASTLAADLRSAGLKPGQPVLVDLPHGLALAVAMVAVVLAGGCAVPLDAAAPPERRDAIRADVNARFSLVQPEGEANIPAVRIIQTQSDPRHHDPDLLFLVYTSGSTGGPKGVKLSNTNYVSRMAHIVPSDLTNVQGVDLCWTPASFIGMLDEIFFPLLCSKPSVIASPDIRVDPLNFAKLIQKEQITAFRITPSLLDLLLGVGLGTYLQSVNDIYCSGEAVSASLLAKAKDGLKAIIWCFYGATEAPGIAYLQVDPESAVEDAEAYTPQPFVAFRIVDPEGEPVTDVSPGEILVGGDVISSGYWQRPALTGEKFFADAETRWYRTGDLGRLRPDGKFEILGRLDLSERKINGTRVSLKELQSAIEDVPGVEAAWVSVLESDDAGQQIRLVGHARTEPDANLSPKDTLDKLGRVLPSPARPIALLCHDAFPLTVNGKLDAQALLRMSHAHLDQDSGPSGDTSLPTKDLEPEILKLVLEVAEELLETGPITGAQNFFRAGGNSLAAVQFALMMSDRLAHELTSAIVFNADTFFDIARNIQNDARHVTSSLRLLRNGTSQKKRLFTINSTGNYARLSESLSPELNVYNLSIFGLTIGLNDRLDSFGLDEIAERFANELLDLCPEGPWLLVAYCQDGCLAVETARVLKRRTGIAANLLLIDTFFTDHRRTIKMHAQSVTGFSLKRIWRKLTKRFSEAPVSWRAAANSKQSQSTQPSKVQSDKRLYARFQQHYMSYEPAPLDTPATLFISREWRHVNLRSVRNMSGSALSIREIEGQHNTLFSSKLIADLGSALNAELESKGMISRFR